MIKDKKNLEQLLEAALMGANKNNRFRMTAATVDLDDNNIKALVKVVDYNEMSSEMHKFELNNNIEEDKIKEIADKIHIREDILRVIKSIIE